ncbi:Dyp-type peroxidase [Mesorhizobium comanense]|uniref:Dyp-type peroxidase n=1 Tax=Mesorhizobium comanense TaxID=2502215 RepID=UPI0014856723
MRDKLPFGEFAPISSVMRARRRTSSGCLRICSSRSAGKHDRLLDFSRATTGSLFFVPPSTFLGDDGPAAQSSRHGLSSDGRQSCLRMILC